jgi:hypothetical protein
MAQRHRRDAVSVLAFGFASLAVCGCGSDSTSPSQLLDTGVSLSFGGQVPAGDTANFIIGFAPGDKLGDPVILRLSYNGGAPAIDTASVPAVGAYLTGGIAIPRNVTSGTLTLTVVLPVERDSASGQVQIVPPPPDSAPTITTVVHSAASPPVFSNDPSAYFYLIAGIADTLAVTATDTNQVAWIGWQSATDSARDSVAVSGMTTQAAFPVTLPATSIGQKTTFITFARAPDGTLAQDTVAIAGVGQYIDHPVQTVPLASAVTDVVYDSTRNVLYLAESGQSSVAVLSLASMTFQPPIPMPAQPMGLDVTGGDDTLVVALANTADLAFVDLTNSTYPTTTVHLSALDGASADTGSPVNTVLFPRVAADGRVILLLAGNGGGVASFDLATQVTTMLTAGSDGTPPARTRDGSSVLLIDVGTNCVRGVYFASSHTFVPSDCGPFGYFPDQVSASRHGEYFAVGELEYATTSLASVGFADIGDEAYVLGAVGTSGVTISNSGTDYYLASPSLCGATACATSTPGFFFHFVNQSNPFAFAFMDLVDTPEMPYKLLTTATDQALIGIGPAHVMMFDLTRSTPASAAQRVAHARRPAVTRRAIHLVLPFPRP